MSPETAPKKPRKPGSGRRPRPDGVDPILSVRIPKQLMADMVTGAQALGMPLADYSRMLLADAVARITPTRGSRLR